MTTSKTDPAVRASLGRVLERLESAERDGVERLCDWLRIPSVSTEPDHKADCAAAAAWAAERLREAGFEVEVVETGGGRGHPSVLAFTPGFDAASTASGARPVLFYGHYDVQPAEPLELWSGDPFEPRLLPGGRKAGSPGERVVARGAVDDKGQVAMFLEAMLAWHAQTGLAAGGAPVAVLIEGEEEIGSVHLAEVIERHGGRLGLAKFCLISDTGMLGPGRPAITCGVRGLAYTQVTLHASPHDLHSGMWGGVVPNPAAELSKVLSQLWDAERRVTILGFYDGVNGPTEAEREAWTALSIDEAEHFASAGLTPESSIGEAGYTAIEREWARPTAEINGLVSGYTGPGAKTIVPRSATAKVSFRLVDDQDPDQIVDLFFGWLQQHTPRGCRWELEKFAGGPAATASIDSPWIALASRAVEHACGVAPALIRTGGSIPIAGMLKTGLGLETVFMGFGLADDNVHGPDEKFELRCFRMGARSHAALVAELLA